MFKLQQLEYHDVMGIGPPPGFGIDGSDPPISSAPVIVARQGLKKTVGQFLPAGGTRKTRVERFLRKNKLYQSDLEKVYDWKTEMVYDQFYRRKDPIKQLSPGVTDGISVSLRIGLSEEHANEIASSMGIAGKNVFAGISLQTSNKSTIKLSVSSEKETTHTVTATNPLSDKYRRIAVWHLVDRLVIVPVPDINWASRIVLWETELILSDETVQTSIDVDI
jgi:hypothetical protein